MQFLHFLAVASLTIAGAAAAPGGPSFSIPDIAAYTAPPSTPCSCPSTPYATSTAQAGSFNNNQLNVCTSGNPFCCTITANGSQSCKEMSGDFSCDTSVVCCNNNGSGSQVCTNSLTIVINDY